MWPLLGWLPTVCLVQTYHHCPYLARICVMCLLIPAWAFLPFCSGSRRYSVATWWQVEVAWVGISGRRHFASSVCSLPWLGLGALLSLAVLVKRGHMVAWVCISGRRHFASSVCSLPWLGLVALLSLAPFCVMCLPLALTWACGPFVFWPRKVGVAIWWQGRGRGFAYLDGTIWCRPSARLVFLRLFVLLCLVALVWRGCLAAGLGWRGLACLARVNCTVVCRRSVFFCGRLSFCSGRACLFSWHGHSVAGLARVWLSAWWGHFALLSVRPFVCLGVCPCCPCPLFHGCVLLTSRNAVCIIITFSRLPPGPAYFTSSVTYPLLLF